MIDQIYLLPLIISFGATLVLTPYVMRFMLRHGVVGRDLNKPGEPEIPEMGGMAMLLGFFTGLFLFLLLNRNLIGGGVMALLLAIMGCAFTGLLDDLMGLRRYVKALLPFFFALPAGLMLRTMPLEFPLVGLVISSTWLVPLLIAFGVTCGANATNTFDGLNGLSTGLTLIAASVLSVIAYLSGRYTALWLLLPLIGALAAFLIYNRYPARVFPGDTLTLSAGGIIASAAIVSGLAQWGIILFTPMIADFFLKVARMFRFDDIRNQGRIGSDGNLHPPKKIVSLTHVVMKLRPMKEWQVVGVFWGVESLLGAGVLLTAVRLV